jgi:hypothetical protein
MTVQIGPISPTAIWVSLVCAEETARPEPAATAPHYIATPTASIPNC